MSTTPTTYMALPVPIVGVESGPAYASDVNNCFTILDLHDHSPGYGVPITPSGLNINTDLTFNGNDAIDLRSTRYTAQSAVLTDPADLGCLYVVNDDLYYNDGIGNNVRITQSGAVAGTPGSIANLVPPASASYVSADSTFVWQSAANTPANMDFASAIFRNLTANSFGVTVEAPAVLSTDYTLVLPTLPGSTKFVSLDASGNFAAVWSTDNVTTEISSNLLQVKDLGISTAKLDNLAVTAAKLAADAVTTVKILDHAVTQVKLQTRGVSNPATNGDVANSNSINFSTTNGGYVDVTGSSLTITTTGRPVVLFFNSDETSSGSNIGLVRSNAGIVQARLKLVRDSTDKGIYFLSCQQPSTSQLFSLPASQVMFFDAPSAGTYTYKVQATIVSGTGNGETISISNTQLVAYEL